MFLLIIVWMLGICFRASALVLRPYVRPRGILFATDGNKIFADQQEAMARQAESERLIFNDCEQILKIPDSVLRAGMNDATGKKRRPKQKAGTGFSKSKTNAQLASSCVSVERKKALLNQGVLHIPHALKRETASSLRACVINELGKAREIVRNDAGKSMSLFHAREEQELRSFLLLPFQSKDDPSDCPIATSIQELFAPGAALGDLYHELYGDKARLYDFYALRTEPGSLRQPIHYDTPITQKKTGPLYATFIALQDISRNMGPTTFLPYTHRYDAGKSNCPGRQEFDHGVSDGRRENFLANYANPCFALLQAGDLVIFDMRILHFGEANSLNDGATRYLLNLTFRKEDAAGMDLGHIPCIRPHYVNKYTLADVRSGSIFHNNNFVVSNLNYGQ